MRTRRIAVNVSLVVVFGLFLAVSSPAQTKTLRLHSFEPGERAPREADGEVVKAHATHGAHAFKVTNPGRVSGLSLSVGFHGGAVVYVNGRELCRGYVSASAGARLAEPYPREVYIDGSGKLISVRGNTSVKDKETVRRIGENLARLRGATDAKGRALEVIEIEQPRWRNLANGWRMSLSYTNFYIANGGIVMPAFEDAQDAKAFEVMTKAFPDRQIIQIPALDIVPGGGCIHCITQQQPAGDPLPAG